MSMDPKAVIQFLKGIKPGVTPLAPDQSGQVTTPAGIQDPNKFYAAQNQRILGAPRLPMTAPKIG